MTNSGLRIFDKTGTSIAGPLDLDAFLTALGATGLSGIGSANLGFDPKVIFDQHSGRFFIVIIDGRTPGAGGRNNVAICTSKTATPSTLTTADWTVETASTLTTFSLGDTWFDYPGIGADATRLVVTGNMFSAAGSFFGTKVRVFLKSSLTDNGAPAGATFNDIDVDNVGQGIFTAQPAHVFGSTLNGDFYLVSRLGSTNYRLWQVTGAGGSASLVAGSPSLHLWTAGAFISAGAPQTNDGMNDEPTISTLASRIQNAVYRNDAGNTDSIWLTLTSDPDGDSRSEVVWFEIDPNTSNSAVAGTLTTPTIDQSGFINGSTTADWTFMPAIAINGSGQIVIGYSESNGAKAVDQRVVSRFATDAAGTFQAPVVIASGAGEYDDFSFIGTGAERWGDYSGAVVDPADDVTFWVSNEITETAATGAGDDADWGTRIARLGAVPTVTSIAPTSGPDTGGTAVTLTGTNFGSGATVALGGVAATSVVVVSPSTITATTGAHAVGTVDVVVTNLALETGTLASGFTYLASGFTDDPLVVGETPIQAVHFTELRSRIDVQRARYSLSAFGYTRTVAAGATIEAADLLEMYTAVNAALLLAGESAIAVPSITAEVTTVDASHINSLRAAVLTLEAL